MSTIRTRSYNASPAPLRRHLFVVAAIFVAMLACETALLAITVGRAPNSITLPLFDQFPLLTTLWGSNPAAAFAITVQQALFTIGHHASATESQVWAIYYFPLTLVAHLFIAWTVASLFHSTAPHEHWRVRAVASGAALLGLGVSYLRLASCCTVAPRWGLDILLLAQALDPTSAGLDWQALYAFIEPAFSTLQIAISAGGVALLLAALKSRVASLPPAPRRHAD